jgi:hypothetical protein
MAIGYFPSNASREPSLEFEVGREKCKRWGIEARDVVPVTTSPVYGPTFAALPAPDLIASVADGQPVKEPAAPQFSALLKVSLDKQKLAKFGLTPARVNAALINSCLILTTDDKPIRLAEDGATVVEIRLQEKEVPKANDEAKRILDEFQSVVVASVDDEPIRLGGIVAIIDVDVVTKAPVNSRPQPQGPIPAEEGRPDDGTDPSLFSCVEVDVPLAPQLVPGDESSLSVPAQTVSRWRIRVAEALPGQKQEKPAPAKEVAVPASALVEQGGATYVFAQPDSKKLVYQQKRVLVVRRSQDTAHLRARLTPDEERQGIQIVGPRDAVATSGAIELKGALDDLKSGLKQPR